MSSDYQPPRPQRVLGLAHDVHDVYYVRVQQPYVYHVRVIRAME